VKPLAVFYMSLSIVLATAALSGCAPAGGGQAGVRPQPTATRPPQPASPSPTPIGQATPGPAATPRPAAKEAAVPSGAEPLVEKARQDAARRAGVARDQVTVKSVRAVQWSDSSLGCPEPGMMYAQVITPGYLISLDAGGKTYVYHSDERDRVVTCDNPRPPVGG
jgi:hypothetical protein